MKKCYHNLLLLILNSQFKKQVMSLITVYLVLFTDIWIEVFQFPKSTLKLRRVKSIINQMATIQQIITNFLFVRLTNLYWHRYFGRTPDNCLIMFLWQLSYLNWCVVINTAQREISVTHFEPTFPSFKMFERTLHMNKYLCICV